MDEVERQLAALRGEPVYLRTMRGNAGDALILQATFDLFDRLGLDWRFMPRVGFDPTAKTIVLAGGGNLVPLYAEAATALAAFAGAAKRVIVLPSTIRGNERLLASLGADVTVFCREADSFAHVQRHARAAGGVLLAEDLAFSLGCRQILSAPPPPFRPAWLAGPLLDRLRRRPDPGSALRLVRAALVARARPPGEVLHCFRYDVERTAAPVPARNIDVPALFELGTEDRRRVRWSAYRLLHYIDQTRVLHTNRLHVAIAGALLGKVVNLYADSSGKGRAVYQHSMRDRFANVAWRGDAPPPTTRRPSWRSRPGSSSVAG
jgi:hypothetical protein